MSFKMQQSNIQTYQTVKGYYYKITSDLKKIRISKTEFLNYAKINKMAPNGKNKETPLKINKQEWEPLKAAFKQP